MTKAEKKIAKQCKHLKDRQAVLVHYEDMVKRLRAEVATLEVNYQLAIEELGND